MLKSIVTLNESNKSIENIVINTKKPKFITFEGIEGVGKSTLAKTFFNYLQEQQVKSILTREPGGTEIAEKIRQVLLNHYQEPMHTDTELLLMFASRAQHLLQIILPALEENTTVICDRFTDASYAYQGGGRGVSFERIALLENFVHPNLEPSHTFLLIAPVQVALARIKSRGGQSDRIEQEAVEFFEQVQNAYLKRANMKPERFYILDATKSVNDLLIEIRTILSF